MNHIHRCLGVLAGLGGALFALAAAAPAAFATWPPPDPGTQSVPVVRTVVGGGMPGWQITMIAVGAALCAAVVAVLIDRAWAARRQLSGTAS